jgi:hypothetical protein
LAGGRRVDFRSARPFARCSTGRFGGRFEGRLRRRQQAVAALRQGFDDARLFRVVAQRLAQLEDDAGERVVADDAVLPDRVLDLRPRDDFAGPAGEIGENLNGLRLQSDVAVAALDPAGRRIHPAVSDPVRPSKIDETGLAFHGHPPSPGQGKVETTLIKLLIFNDNLKTRMKPANHHNFLAASP